jgi:exosortase
VTSTPNQLVARVRYFVFALLFATSLLIWGRPLLGTFESALHSDQYTHILLVFPVSAALILVQWAQGHDRGWPGLNTGLPLLTLALVMLWIVSQHTFSFPDLRLTAIMTTLVIWWIGCVVVSFGSRALRAYAFPLLFLFWLVPLPTVVVDRVVALLQKSSALATYWLFWITQVPVMRDGVVLSIPGISIEVAVECSSIRSSLMLILSTMVLAHLFLRSLARKITLVLLAVPLSIAKNAIRIFTLSMLGTHVDPGFLTGRLHHDGGIIFFLLALALVILLVKLLREQEASEALAT